jgi:hypothetical protein
MARDARTADGDGDRVYGHERNDTLRGSPGVTKFGSGSRGTDFANVDLNSDVAIGLGQLLKQLAWDIRLHVPLLVGFDGQDGFGGDRVCVVVAVLAQEEQFFGIVLVFPHDGEFNGRGGRVGEKHCENLGIRGKDE